MALNNRNEFISLFIKLKNKNTYKEYQNPRKE